MLLNAAPSTRGGALGRLHQAQHVLAGEDVIFFGVQLRERSAPGLIPKEVQHIGWQGTLKIEDRNIVRHCCRHQPGPEHFPP